MARPPPFRAGRASFIGSYPGELPAPSLPEVAFAGRSNVGKSSALNALLGVAGLARTSGTPGRTQAINLFDVDERWIAADLPGYGYAKVSHASRAAWKGLIERYLGERPTLRLVVVLIDSRIPPQESDTQLLRSLTGARIPVLVLATKVDGIPRGKRPGALAALAKGHGIPVQTVLGFSATERIGIDEARDMIAEAVAPPRA